ncbi:FG-GAP repeat domain-containing protein [Thalassotalea sp. PS06]|uniref:FG-GAP repeat domain-containing protein n=1 Tax=Thalassotalea sp. PS06 TaxID=2594005 RepID=UPI001164B24C|nr:VCBS repeat-containing protein [Thalassotalea sp. PS06]QDP01918.1 VCBS repeat-containing protein [Thalassotalea sp. PS06]
MMKVLDTGKLLVAGSAMAIAGGAQAESISLKSQTISAPFSISQDPIRGNFLPNPGKEIILIGENDGQGQLAIFAVDERSGEYELFRHLPIDSQFFSFDTDAQLKLQQGVAAADKSALNRLYFLTSDQVVELRPEDASQPYHPKLDVKSIVIKDSSNYLKRANFVKHLNRDNHPDFALTDFKGINLYVSTQANEDKASEDGKAQVSYVNQQIPVTPIVEVFESSVSYTQRKWFLTDMNQDGKVDINWVNDGDLLVHYAKDNAEFSLEPTVVSINSQISGQNWWDTRNADGSNLDQSNLDHKNLERMEDINGDGITDLIVRHSTSSGVLDRSNDYQVYLGQVKNNQVVYSEQPNTVLASDGTVGDIEFVDLNRDARQEVLMSSFDISVSQIIGALLSGSVDQDVLIYVQDSQSGLFKQSISKEVELTFSLSTGKSGAPVVKLADLNGDGYKELILSADEDKLKIYAGVNGDQYIASKAQKFSLPLPKNGVLLSSDDLNLDGKEELLVRYGDEDAEQYHDDLLIVSAK